MVNPAKRSELKTAAKEITTHSRAAQGLSKSILSPAVYAQLAQLCDASFATRDLAEEARQ